ncbi:MAG: orotate phosphoribosyltransferase [Phycisphaeraceae bacterium]|nr:orotate phosphoribosyltransferase [Phycisphaeraceae bacterium]
MSASTTPSTPTRPSISAGGVDRATLAKAIAEAALLRGTFTLRSGRTSSYYLDKYLFSTRPEVLAPLAELFAERIGAMASRAGVASGKPDRLAGAELGGIPLVTAASLRTGIPCLFIRNAKKDYGTAKQLEGSVEAGQSVILLEDVATTAGQALEAVKVLQGLKADVLGVIATIDRQEGATENMLAAGVPFEALFTKADLGIAE